MSDKAVTGAKHTMKRVIPLRAYLIVQTSFHLAASCYAENEQVYALMRAGGAAAYGVMIAMLVLTALAGADVFLSESDSRWWTWIRRRRWLVWIALGCGHAMQAAVAATNGFMPWVAGNFFLMAGGCAAVAALDIHYRGNDARVRLRESGCGDFDSRPMDRSWLA